MKTGKERRKYYHQRDTRVTPRAPPPSPAHSTPHGARGYLYGEVSVREVSGEVRGYCVRECVRTYIRCCLLGGERSSI